MIINKSMSRRKLKMNLLQRFLLNTRDQSVQTSFETSKTTTIHLQSHSQDEHRRIRLAPKHHYRSSIRTFLLSHSPKSFPFIRRSRRRSLNVKPYKSIASDHLPVALVRKIPSIQKRVETISRSSTVRGTESTIFLDELSLIGPMTWSTPNRTHRYQTSSPIDFFDHPTRSCQLDQLSFSNILDCSE